MKKLVLVMVVSGVLSGCSGASSSSNSEELYSDNSTLSKVKSMFKSNKNTTTKEVNVATLIASSFGVLEIPLQRFNAVKSSENQDIDKIATQIDTLINAEEFKKTLPDLKANILSQESDIQKIKSQNQIIYDRALKAFNAAKTGNDDNFLWGFNVQNIVANSVIGEANSGCSGWYSGMGNRYGSYSEMYAIYETVLIANSIETKIADAMLDKTFYSEEDARKFIINTYYSMSTDEIYNIVVNAQKEAQSLKFTADFTGVKGIQFTTNNGASFACTNEGTIWSKNNDNWFGGGNLSGKKYITKVEYSDSIEQGKSLKMDLNSGTSNSNSNSADMSAKAK